MEEYTVPIDEVLANLETSPEKGLDGGEAARRLEQYGNNELQGEKHRNLFQKFMDQLKDYMVIILIAAAIISFIIGLTSPEGEFIDAIVIVVIVVVNAILGVFQENSAEKALDALKDMAAPYAKVIRSGSTQKVPSSDLVPGDILLLEAGDLIPADARLVECASLKCEESALTGESVPVDKDIQAEIGPDAALGDRLNMVYSGCSVSYGRAKAVITATGMKTEMGKIASLLRNEKNESTPLQERLNQLGKYLGFLAIGICVFIFILGLFQGEDPVTMFMTAVSLAVAAIPEGLTTVVTLVLAMGVQKMVKKHAIVRRLPAVEALGSTSVICSDKTGTLTQNRMTVMQVWAAGGEAQAMSPDLPEDSRKILLYSALCNDGQVTTKDGRETHIGDPTETALVAAAKALGLDKENLEQEHPRMGEIPFDSDRKLMTTINLFDGRPVAIVKGGFDVMLPLCTSGDTSRAEEINLSMGRGALRVLALGYRVLDEVPSVFSPDILEKDLHFMGLVGMIDPPREESKEAIATCFQAGIKTVMITGDHIVTATAIARELGILHEEDEAISGRDLAGMSDEDLIKNIRKYAVYARVSPEDKIRIVKAWQANGEVVAMTGDGVNDAPALKAADIGCAMGITGTDVAKGAADMVLTDDNFSTIVSAVKEGRSIYDNIKKTIGFLLGSNIGEILTVFIAMILGWGAPLLAIQILMVNVVTDAFPAFALGFEMPDKDIMERKPVNRSEGIFAGGMIADILTKGILISILTLTAYHLGTTVTLSPAILPSAAVGQTMAFLTLSIGQLVYAFNSRSRHSLFKVGFFSNKRMVQAFLLSLVIVLSITLIPALEVVFRMTDLSLVHWAIVWGLALLPLILVEIQKNIAGRKKA